VTREIFGTRRKKKWKNETLNNEDLHNLYASPNITRKMRLRKIR
jgi:hypothetical protein